MHLLRKFAKFPFKRPCFKRKGDFLNIPMTLTTLLACLILLVGKVGAQSHSGDVTVNIRFLPVQTISVQTSQKITDLLYTTAEDYEKGVSVTHDDHLKIFSSGGFQVSVTADDADFRRSGSNETIPLDDLIIRAAEGSYSGIRTRYAEVALSTALAPIIESEDGGRDLKYNITYDNRNAGSAQHYIDKYVKSDGTETVYSANITYTITTR